MSDKIEGDVSDLVDILESRTRNDRMGSYGSIPEVPAQNSSRGVYFVTPAGAGDLDGSTQANALAGTYDVITNTATANNQDLFIFIGSFDFNGAAGGLAISVAGVKVFGLGGTLTSVVNSSGTATAVITIGPTATNVEVAGFHSIEATIGVEFLVANADGCHVHSNFLIGGMENGIHLINADDSIVERNRIFGCSDDGIELSGTIGHVIIRDNYIFAVGDNGIHLNGNGIAQIFICGNIINGAGVTTTGISILLGDTNIVTGGFIGGCTNIMIDTGTGNVWNIDFDEITGSFNMLVADGVGEVNKILSQDLPRSGKYVIQLDVNTVEGEGTGTVLTFTAFVKIDNTTLRKVGVDTYQEGVSVIHPTVEFYSKGGDSVFQLSSQASIIMGGTNAIPYKILPAQ